jgi:nucleoid DNA-binding protein
MTEAELIARVAKRADDYQRYTKTVLNALFAELTEAFEHGESVNVRGFGTFKVVKGRSREGFVAGPGTRGKLPAAMRVKFIASAKLKGRVG